MEVTVSIRDKILSADDLTSELVDVPEWDVKIEVRSPTAKVRSHMISLAMRKDEDGDSTIDLESVYPQFLISCCFDPETGEKVFEDGDQDVINAKSSAPVERVAKACLRVAGLSDDTEKTLGKD
jgi:hypothetical protein